MLFERGAESITAQAGPGWWAVYTRHQHEKIVAEMLSVKGCEVFLPLYQSLRRWKDRTTKLSFPLFPSYVFVREQPDRRLQIVTTPGIHMIVSRGERFAVVQNDEIQAIQRAAKGLFVLEPHPSYTSGKELV